MFAWVDSCSQGSGFKVQGSEFRVQGSGFMVQGSGFRVQGSGFRVQGSESHQHPEHTLPRRRSTNPACSTPPRCSRNLIPPSIHDEYDSGDLATKITTQLACESNSKTCVW